MPLEDSLLSQVDHTIRCSHGSTRGFECVPFFQVSKPRNPTVTVSREFFFLILLLTQIELTKNLESYQNNIFARTSFHSRTPSRLHHMKSSIRATDPLKKIIKVYTYWPKLFLLNLLFASEFFCSLLLVGLLT